MAMFPEAWMSELLARNDIVSVVSEYLTLKQKGNKFWGLCPFHGEKTASFSVQADKQFFYCFGCHAGGDVIRFVMDMQKLSFVEAVKTLADRANMSLPEQEDEAQFQKQRALRDRLYALCKESARFFYQQLKADSGKIARNYLAHRGMDAQTIVGFGLGYALPAWHDLRDHLQNQGFSQEDMIAAGVLQKKKDRTYDAFRGRVMFPIIGTHQRVIGFGARALGEEHPKYLNSPETEIFNKRLHLYGLNGLKHQSLQDIVVVEGYMDVIGLYQSGIKNAVASLGTALTSEQARLIKRYAKQVYMAYDGDAAGQNATLRGMDILANEELDVKIIRIPGGKDPDEFVRENGQDAFEQLKQDAISMHQFYLETIQTRFDMDRPEEREKYARQASAYIEGLLPLERERYYKVLSRLTEYPIDVLKQEGLLGQYQHQQEAKKEQKRVVVQYRKKAIDMTRERRDQRLRNEQILLHVVLADTLTGFDQWDVILSILRTESLKKAAERKKQNPNCSIMQEMAMEDEVDLAQIAAVFALENVDDTWDQLRASWQALAEMDIDEELQVLQEKADDATNSLQERLQYAADILELTKKRDALRTENPFANDFK